MNILQHKAFENDTVVLDGKHFVDCTFQSCTLEYSGGPVVFERTHLSRCNYLFFAEAQSTVRFLQELGLMPFDPSQWAEMTGLVH